MNYEYRNREYFNSSYACGYIPTAKVTLRLTDKMRVNYQQWVMSLDGQFKTVTLPTVRYFVVCRSKEAIHEFLKKLDMNQVESFKVEF